MVKLLHEAEHYGCKRYTGAAAGDLAKQNAKVAAATDRPYGILVDEIRTDNPPDQLTLHGNGALIDMTGATGWPGAQAVGTVMWSDGDGTISTVKPTPGVGSMRWQVGVIEGDEDAGTSSNLRVAIRGEVQEA